MSSLYVGLGQVADRILKWGVNNLRWYPWRSERDPYKVLVAEMLLQRTKAEQVLKIYEEFLRQYPQPSLLAHTELSKVEKLLYPLGLRWRAKKIWQMAQVLVKSYGGVVRPDREMLTRLPGVGDYVASAVLCFAFGRIEPLIDSNIARVITRLLGLNTRKEPRRNAQVRSALVEIQKGVPVERCREFYWGLLDLAASVCTPRDPKCPKCPLLDLCVSGRRIFSNGT